MRWSLALVVMLGCNKVGTPDTSDPASGDLLWYATCGDPVCNTYSGPWDGVPLCETEAPGQACSAEGSTCDPQNDCNSRLICSTEDPTQQEGGCPISRLRHKKSVHYLSAQERAAAAATLASTPLATWRYNWEPDDARPHLGFVIDDNPASPAVAADGEHVDLYGYTSLTVAAVQAQQAELESLRAELAALRAEVASLRGAPGQAEAPQ